MAILKQSVLEGCSSIPGFIATNSQMVFYQASAPTSWVKLDSGVNDAAMRVVTGVGGNITNTNGFSSVFINRTVPLPEHNHTASTNSAGNHSHSGSTDSAGNHSHSGGIGGAGAHTHSLNYTPIKDGGGILAGRDGPAHYMSTGGGVNGVGNHSHSLSIYSNGDHSHGLSINSNGSHTHGVTVNNAGTANASMNFAVKYVDVIICRKQ